MVAPKGTEQRLLDLGPANFFRPEASAPSGNQVVVKAGFAFAGGHAIYDRFTAGDQLTAGFTFVAGGFRRYDLVYLDNTGAVQILAGTALAAGQPAFQGAPGWVGTNPGPTLPDDVNPVAWVLVDETVTVVIDPADITPINGFVRVQRELDGYCIDKGLIGAAPTGASDVVTAAFAGEVPGGGNTQVGVVTAPPNNLVDVLDEFKDELIHTVDAARVYGRMTEAAGVWTLSYFYTSAAGAETAVAAIETDCTRVPANLQMACIRKVFSRNDPNRPLFSTGVVLSDQVAGDIPVATTSVEGKVRLAANVDVLANRVVQSDNTRLLTQDERNAALTANVTGTPAAGNPFVVDDDPRFAGIFVPEYFSGYYNGGTSSLPAGRILFNQGNVKSQITQDATTGAFSVVNAGFYKVTCSAEHGGGANSTGTLASPAGSALVNDQKVEMDAGAAGSGQDHMTMAVILDMGALGTFDVRNLGPDGWFASKVTHIAIHRIA